MGPLLLAVPLLLGAANDIQSVEIVWQTPRDGYPARGPAYVRADEDVHLSLLVTFRDGSCAVRAGAWQDEHGRDHLCDRELQEVEDLRADWMRVVPVQSEVTRSPRGLGAPLPFRNEPYARMSAARSLLMEPPACPDGEDALAACGTMRFAVRLEGLDLETLAFSGDATEPARAFAVHIRTSDDALGVLHELAHVPRVDSPRGAPTSHHETELGLGVDDVSMVTYVARRMGMKVGYQGWASLEKVLVPVEGRARVQAGDVVHDGSVVRVVAEDAGRRGVLDGADVLLSVEDGPLRTVRVEELGKGVELRVYRVKGMTGKVPRRAYRMTNRRKIVDVRREPKRTE